MSENFPATLKYTAGHEWAETKGSDVRVGITKFAVEQLGDITLVNVDVKVGDSVTAGQAFGSIESVKTLSDLYAPVSGKVTGVNAALEKKPELVNEDCYASWMISIAPASSADVGKLMDAKAYGEHVLAAAH